MSTMITITYNPAEDILNARISESGVITPAPIPGLGGRRPASDAYIYASDTSNERVYNAEILTPINQEGTEETGNTTADVHFNTGGQRRWATSRTDSINTILAAYATPQVPVYRAWQTIKLAIEGGSKQIEVDNDAEREFYLQAGAALKEYGITISLSTPATSEEGHH